MWAETATTNKVAVEYLNDIIPTTIQRAILDMEE